MEKDNKDLGSREETSRGIQPGKYRHYKGGEYLVIDVASHSETEELLVVYRPLYGDQNLWVRPFDMFTDMVTVDGRQESRFKFIGEFQN